MIAIIIKSQMTGRTSIKKFNTMDDLRAYVGSQSLPESLIQNEQDLAVAVQNVVRYLSRSHIDAQVVTEDELRRLQEAFKALQDKVNTWTNGTQGPQSEPIAKSDAVDLYDQYRPQLEAIAQIESTSHRFREHPLVQKGVHKDTRSISSYGIMPKSAYELAIKDPNFASTATGKAIKQAATPVPNAPAGTEWKNVAEITRDRKHDDAAAAAVWHYQRSRVSKFAPKDANLDAMTAYAHRNGITATFQLINQDNGYQSLLAHPYVSTFLKNLSSQKPAKK